MAVLNIRNLSDDVHRRLRMRAARLGRSMEAEARRILERELATEAPAAAEGVDSLQDFVAGLYGGRPPHGVVDELLASRRTAAREEAAESRP